MKKLKNKLILVFALMIIIILGLAAFLQIKEKERDFISETFYNSKAFAELSSVKIIQDYKSYLVPKSFLYFNREISDLFTKNEDISEVKIANYSGELLYDSRVEKEKQYDGEKRFLDDKLLLQQLKARSVSVKTLEKGRVILFEKKDDGMIVQKDLDGNLVEELGRDEKISYIVVPVDESYSTAYYVNYDSLNKKIADSMMRIVVLALFAVSLAIFVALFFGTTVTRPIKKLTEGADILAKGDFEHRVEVKTKDEIKLLANSFNKMAADLAVSTKALVYKERVAKELELANKIQKELLPAEVPIVKGVEFSAGIIPAEEIGGDVYDFIKVDENKMVFYLGDVTGHGVPSGIVVSIANSLLYAYSTQKSLKDTLIEVNRVMKVKTAKNMFMTLVVMLWDLMENKFKYVSAGHEQVLVYRKAKKEVEMLPSGGMALGMIPNIDKLLVEREVALESGDVMLLYSDGIPEAWRSQTEMYGMQRLKDAFAKNAELESTLAVKNAILSDVYDFRKDYKQMDDITILVVRKV